MKIYFFLNFFKSAFRDEKWIATKDCDQARTLKIIKQPERPPPRTLSDVNLRVNNE
jgi:hypothetical protein